MNYTGTWRSNYFKVKDIEKLNELIDRDWCVNEINIADGKERHPGCVMLHGSDSFPGMSEEENPADFIVELGKHHLVEDEVAIFQEVGYEGNRYVFGMSAAVNHKGETLYIDLNEIYNKVTSDWKKEGFTHCEY